MFDEGYPIAVAAHHTSDDYTTPESTARVADLGITAFPTLIPDGQPEPSYPYSHEILETVINDRMAVPSPCTISLSGSLVAGNLTVNVTVTKDDGADMPNPRVQVIVTESDVSIDNPEYNNELNHINRDMLDDQDGTPITFEGNSASVSVTADLPAGVNADNLIIIAFVEDSSTLNVFNTSRADIAAFLFPPAAPGMATNLEILPDEGGALTSELSWNNPAISFGGDALTELMEVRVYREGELIHTEESPEIGGAVALSDAVTTSGAFEYWIVGYNSEGEGAPAIQSVWIGEDVPNLVEDLTLVDQGGTALISWLNPTTGLHGGAFNNPVTGYHIVRSDGVTYEVDGLATEYMDDAIVSADYYSYTVTTVNAIGDGGQASSNTEWIGEGFSGIIILDLDITPTGDILQTAIMNEYDGSVVIATDINTYPLTSSVDAVFVLLGIYSNNYAISEAEAALLTMYLDAGGKVYMEGGDTWAYDSATSVHPYFGIDGLADGDSDLVNISGSGFLAGMTWNYNGENNWIDQLGTVGDAVALFKNSATENICGVANTDGNYSTVGTSFEITGLTATGRFEDAVHGILEYFNVLDVIGSDDSVIPVVSSLIGNYPNPFNPTTNIEFALKTPGKVTLKIYNAKGQTVNTLVNRKLEAGTYTETWNGLDSNNQKVGSGIYFYRLDAENYSATKKMILLK